MRGFTASVAVFALAACSTSTTPAGVPDSGSGLADSGAPDAGLTDAGTDAGPDGGQPDSGAPGKSDAGSPIVIPGTAPYDQWTFVPISGAFCGNGSPTGLVVNPHAGSNNLLVYFQGGGACWSYGLCGGGGAKPTASHLDGFGAANVAADGIPRYQLFDRADATNPFANDSFAFIPYCTGDVHSGSNVQVYSDGGAGTLSISHVGYSNVGADLSTILATFPTPARLVVAGSSAGGYGSAFNYGRIHAAYPTVPSFLIDDSGPPLRPPYGTAAWYDIQAAVWGSNANLPAGCPSCSPSVDGGGLFNLLPYYAQDSSFRGSLLETERDDVISAFYAIPPGDQAEICFADGGGPCQFQAGLNDLNQNVIQDAGPGQLRVYFVNDVFHTYLPAKYDTVENAVTLKTFLFQQLGDAGAWSSVLPQ